MSRKTVAFKQKITQFVNKNSRKPLASDILPMSRTKSPGRKCKFAAEDFIDEEGRLVRAGRRGRPIASNAVCTEPIGSEKADRLMRAVK